MREIAISLPDRALLKDPKAGAFCKADITFDDVHLFCNICAVLFLIIEHALENVEHEIICNRVALLAINYKFPLKFMIVAMLGKLMKLKLLNIGEREARTMDHRLVYEVK